MAAPLRDNKGSNGKLVDTWWYEYEGIESPEDIEEEDPTPPQVIAKKVAVELRIIKNYEGDTPPLATKSVYFVLICKEAGIRMNGGDIEALRAAMWGQLDKKYEVRWEQYFLVRVDQRAPFDGMGTGMTVSYNRVHKGFAWDGTVLLKERMWGRSEETITKWPGEFIDKSGNVMACIPVTEENEHALQEFCKAVDAMRDKIADYLRPDVIMRTLAAAVAGQGLLSAPREETEYGYTGNDR